MSLVRTLRVKGGYRIGHRGDLSKMEKIPHVPSAPHVAIGCFFFC